MSKTTRAETELLLKHAKRQEAVAIEYLRATTAERKAAFEEQLATIFQAEDDAWGDIVAEAQRQVSLANYKIAQICRQRSIPESFAPQLTLPMWVGRGENTFKERRTELRKVAYTRFDEMEKSAIATVKQQIVAYEGEIIKGHLASAAALLQLDDLPTLQALIPQLDAAEIQKSLPLPGTTYQRHGL